MSCALRNWLISMSNEGALANLDVDAALTEIASGVLSKEIAARYGVTPRGLRWALAKHPDYKQAVAEQAHSIVEDAMHEMMTVGADDALPIARARARVDAAFKYAKAHNPAYADKQTEGGVQLVVNIAPPEAVTGQAVRVELPAIEADGK